MARRLTLRTRRAPLSQTVHVIAEASSADELRNQTPAVSELQEGARGQIKIRGFFGLGAVARAPGAEIIWRQFLNPAGLDIIDVHGEGFSTAVIEWGVPVSQAQGEVAPQRFVITVLVILAAIAGALAVLGWVISKITVLLFGSNGSGSGVFGTTGLLFGAMVVAGIYLLRPKEASG